MKEFKFKCPACSQHILATSAWAGRRFRCPSCNTSILIPDATSAIVQKALAKPAPAPVGRTPAPGEKPPAAAEPIAVPKVPISSLALNKPKPAAPPQPLPTNHGIYVALRDPGQRSEIEDSLVLDGFDVSAFPTAKALWEVFRERPTRFVITDRRFPDGFTGLQLCRNIRENFQLPYVYVLVFSVLNRLGEIKEALAAGADDYLVRPLTPAQVRARVMVGRRWLTCLDSLYKQG